MKSEIPHEFDLCSLEELQIKKSISFQFDHPVYGKNEIALFWDGQNIGALDNYCPHQGAMLTHGLIEPGEIICPLHSAVFDLKTGECLDKYTWDTVSYQVRIENNRVLIIVPDQTLIH
ncbi:MAG: Rieske 2Fe-2S domain-containing protein [SAR202 cluster bacterium]|nr:Rieske 2Fe-2S domain-containing protein [SAR202 cluster bacterium]|tara:strand:- start:45094 stop:45447 length:354 start_codon:yes stop_codon:yes gene_type:complete